MNLCKLDYITGVKPHPVQLFVIKTNARNDIHDDYTLYMYVSSVWLGLLV